MWQKGVLKTKKEWPDVTFSGGHVEYTESFTQSVIREVKEETGLDIERKTRGRILLCKTRKPKRERSIN